MDESRNQRVELGVAAYHHCSNLLEEFVLLGSVGPGLVPKGEIVPPGDIQVLLS